MTPFDKQFRKIANECRRATVAGWDEVFQKHGLNEDEIKMIKEHDLEKRHFGRGY